MAWSKDCMLKKICHLLIYIDKTTAIIEQEASFDWKENDFLCHMAKTFLGYLGFCLSSGAWAEMYKSWLNERDKFPRGYFIHWQLLTPKTGLPIYLGTKKAWAVITFCNSFAKGGMVCEVNFLSQVPLADAGRTSLVSFLLLYWMASQDIQFQWQIAWSPFVWGSGHRSKDVFSLSIFFTSVLQTSIRQGYDWAKPIGTSIANYWIFAKT